MEISLDEWLSEYDELTGDVLSSAWRTFPHNLQRWYAVLDGYQPFSNYVSVLEGRVLFDDWYSHALTTAHSMAGSGRLDWPTDADQRLGMELALFRRFGLEELSVPDFAIKFFYTNGDFNAQVRNIALHLFTPFAKELRRYLLRKARADNEIPASDRNVFVDHNSIPYHEINARLSQLERELGVKNDYPDQIDREQRLSELSAGRELLKSKKVSLRKVEVVLLSALRYLAEKFADNAIGVIAAALITLLLAYLGVTL